MKKPKRAKHPPSLTGRKPAVKIKRKPAKTPVKLLPKSKRRRDICEYD